MPFVGEIDWHVAGDIGGVGVSRFRFTRQDAGPITGADVNAAAAASHGLFVAAAPYIPTVISWTCQSVCNVYDVATGLVQGPLPVTSVPTTVPGSGGVNFSAGTGGRVNWKTSTLRGRRLMRGTTYLVPLSSAAFTTTGGIGNTVANPISTAATAYLTALTTATLYGVVWHRPLKGQSSGGQTGILYAGLLSNTPSTLRSRRH